MKVICARASLYLPEAGPHDQRLFTTLRLEHPRPVGRGPPTFLSKENLVSGRSERRAVLEARPSSPPQHQAPHTDGGGSRREAGRAVHRKSLRRLNLRPAAEQGRRPTWFSSTADDPSGTRHARLNVNGEDRVPGRKEKRRSRRRGTDRGLRTVGPAARSQLGYAGRGALYQRQTDLRYANVHNPKAVGNLYRDAC